MSTATHKTAMVYGAYGHTGRFVVSELRKRNWRLILSGRDPIRLADVGTAHGGLPIRPAAVDDPASLDRALTGAGVVINCAGPFRQTAGPVVEAALRAGIPYLDVAAELEVVADTFERFAEPARAAGITVLPTMAFYGGLGDLLATAAVGGARGAADELSLAYALTSWKPTLGTRAAGRSNTAFRGEGRRPVLVRGRIEYRTEAAPVHEWSFPEPFGRQRVVAEYTTSASLAISRHLAVPEIHSFMTAAPLADLSDPDLSPPPAVDDSGRSAQLFLVEVVARRGGAEMRAVASGRDTYAISAPIVVEAAERVVGAAGIPPGVVSAGEVFDAPEILGVLGAAGLAFRLAGGDGDQRAAAKASQ